jgi:hypothetical protein
LAALVVGSCFDWAGFLGIEAFCRIGNVNGSPEQRRDNDHENADEEHKDPGLLRWNSVDVWAESER